jgi:hypothetical protein
MRNCGSHLSARFLPVSDPGIGALTPDKSRNRTSQFKWTVDAITTPASQRPE